MAYEKFPHRMCTTHAGVINARGLAFITSEGRSVPSGEGVSALAPPALGSPSMMSAGDSAGIGSIASWPGQSVYASRTRWRSIQWGTMRSVTDRLSRRAE